MFVELPIKIMKWHTKMQLGLTRSAALGSCIFRLRTERGLNKYKNNCDFKVVCRINEKNIYEAYIQEIQQLIHIYDSVQVKRLQVSLDNRMHKVKVGFQNLIIRSIAC